MEDQAFNHSFQVILGVSNYARKPGLFTAIVHQSSEVKLSDLGKLVSSGPELVLVQVVVIVYAKKTSADLLPGPVFVCVRNILLRSSRNAIINQRATIWKGPGVYSCVGVDGGVVASLSGKADCSIGSLGD